MRQPSAYYELVDPRRYLPLLEALFALEPRVFIVGGIAEDALLNGTMTRDHYDVDMTTLREDVPRRDEQLAKLDFPQLEVKHEVLPGLVMVYETGHDDLRVEIGPYDELAPRRHFVRRSWGGRTRADPLP